MSFTSRLLAYIKKDMSPAIPPEEMTETKLQQIMGALKAIIPPLILIILVLGFIFRGIATPTVFRYLAVWGRLRFWLDGTNLFHFGMILRRRNGNGEHNSDGFQQF